MTLTESRDAFIDFLDTKLTARGITLEVLQSHKDFLKTNAINLAIITDRIEEGLYPKGITELDVSIDILTTDSATVTSERQASIWCGYIVEDLKEGSVITNNILKLSWDLKGEGVFINIPHDEYIHRNLMLTIKTY